MTLDCVVHMKKVCKIVKSCDQELSSTKSKNFEREVCWSLCILCQENNSESLVCPANSKHKDIGAGYKSLSDSLSQFNELDAKPFSFDIKDLDDGSGIEATLTHNKAVWHKSCRNKINSTELRRAQKRKTNDSHEACAIPAKTRRSYGCSTDQQDNQQCFFCDGSDGKLHKASTLEIDQKVRKYAHELQDRRILSKLAAGDMVAIDAVYHSKCIVSFYNRARARISDIQDQETNQSYAIAFAEIVSFIEECREKNDTLPVFTLADLSKKYSSILDELGVDQNARIHSTRLKEKLLLEMPELVSYKKGRDILIAFNEDVGEALLKACKQDFESDALHLARAARIIRRDIFAFKNKQFNGSFNKTQEHSIPSSLRALVGMILEGPCPDIDDLSDTQAGLTISQLIGFNCVKHRHDTTKDKCDITGAEDPRHAVPRHNRERETPLSLYVGLKIYAETRNKSLIDTMFRLGLSISYDRVLSISTDIANSVCNTFDQEGVVCPPALRGDLFTTAALDNIDHNPSATTSKDSFHGTAISLAQHPTSDSHGFHRGTNVITETTGGANVVKELPESYKNVPPAVLKIKDPVVPNLTGMALSNIMDHNPAVASREIEWFRNVISLFKHDQIKSDEFITWAAFNASLQEELTSPIDIVALLPLFLEEAHSVAMIRHGMNIVNKAVQHLNPGQTPVIAMDQPLFAIAKQIQWDMPGDSLAEDRYVVMFGGLHIEIAAFKALGELLNGTGWANVLVNADIASSGTADSFLKVSHLAKTRRAHQVTAAALSILRQQAYDTFRVSAQEADDETTPLSFEEWCKKMSSEQPQFHFWCQVLEFQYLILEIVRAIREGNFTNYVQSLKCLMPWMFALDRVNYARWLPVHIRDMVMLPTAHPDVYEKFSSGAFVVHKSTNAFSAIALDHAHEQENASIKGDGGAVGITESPAALRHWMIGGPELSRMIHEYEGQLEVEKNQQKKHHEQLPSIQNAFFKNVKNLVNAIEDLGNPFEEDSGDLLVLDTKDIMPSEVVESLKNIQKTGKDQYKAFVNERIASQKKPISEPIKLNKLPLFGRLPTTAPYKTKTQIAALKDDCSLFSRLYIACQSREGNLKEFFMHENHPWPPSLSQYGQLRQGNKAELVQCLLGSNEGLTESPPVDVKIYDGAVLVQMLHPKTAVTFKDYAQTVFLPYIKAQLQSAKRVDVVWDVHKTDSLKASTREKRGNGARRRVALKVKIPTNWKSFLRVDDNKRELFELLANELVNIDTREKEVYSTRDNQVISNTRRENLEDLQPCNHEEADTRLFLHVIDAATSHQKILIRTVDTDVFVLAVSQMHRIPQKEVWLAFGMGKQFHIYAIHEIARTLGPQKSLALPVFHALTGCDTVSFFAGKSKKTAWDTWSVFPEVTNSFLEICTAPKQLSDDCTKKIERFVVLMYDRGSELTSVDETRQQLFCKKSRSFDRIPPSSSALKQHILRASYQGGHIWSKVHVTLQELPHPAEWGWELVDGQWKPVWSTLPQAQQICHELIHCKCKKAYRGLCRCSKANLHCTMLCACGGDCYN